MAWLHFHHTRHRKTHYCPRYYVYGTKKKMAKIGVKRIRGYNLVLNCCHGPAEQAHLPNNDQSVTQAPRMASFETGCVKIRIDSHSSYCVSPNRSDFVGPLVPLQAIVRGIGNAKIEVKHKGTVRWYWHDDQGRLSCHDIPNTLYMPGNAERILAPHHWSQSREHDDAHAVVSQRGATLIWDKGQRRKTIPLDEQSNVPWMWSASVFDALPNVVSDDEQSTEQDNDQAHDSEGESTTSEGAQTEFALPTAPRPVTFGLGTAPVIIPPDTIHLEETRSPQQEYLGWHHRLNHIGHMKLVQMVKQGYLPKRLLNVRPPRCAACLIGRATRRPWRTKMVPHKQRVPSAINPGDVVSVDQLQSTTPGLIGRLRGFLTKKRFHFATVFVDQATDLSYVHLQQSSNSVETIQAKEAFESYARERGVLIKHYHADNGRFAEQAFMSHIREQGQTISFCGVNAHHQNGVAEKRIRDLQEATRSLLIHSKRRWPDAIDTCLWPYALRTANHMHNHTPSLKTNKIPVLSFSQINTQIDLKQFHTFGCPAYVLDGDLQSGVRRSHHKWGDRARIAINLGPSPNHGSSVSLLLNTQTGTVSPQFHAKYDDHFDTTRKDSATRLPKCLWQQKNYFTNDKVPDAIPAELTQCNQRVPVPTLLRDHPETVIPPQVQQQHATAAEAAGERQQQQGPATVQEVPRTTRSGRQVRTPQRYLDSFVSVANYNGTFELGFQEQDPFQLLKATNDPDTLYLKQAMRAHDWKDFHNAMLKEVRDHEQRGHWKLVKRSSVPTWAIILPAIWSMKRKRRLHTGEVYKHKSRLTLGGHKERPLIDYNKTYSPVVSWPTIRLFLIFFLLKGWKTRQLDFVLAYPQADVPKETYMEIPPGFSFKGSRKDYVLRIVRNVYGGHASGRQWYLYVTKYLTNLGFKQSQVDPCVFYYKQCVLLLYVDDVIIGGPTDKDLADVIETIKDNVDIEDQGDITDYVGVNVQRHEDGSMELTQPQLIQSILDDLHLNSESKQSSTPSLSTVLLHAALDDDDHDGHFDYRSVIGKLNYLEKSTQGDIAYAVHQCARFMANPKKSHAQAVKRIGRYLLGTKEKGLIIKPDETKSFECFVDASFAGEWSRELQDQAMTDPNLARSRTGYLITYAGVPLTWASKLQTEISLSSTEAEMVALSTATRECIFLLRLIQDAQQIGRLDISLNNSKLHCRLFEDNQGTIAIADEPRIRPRTKHMCTKLWHFKTFLEQGLLDIEWISTKHQVADIFTKPLNTELFQRFTPSVCGWTSAEPNHASS